MARYKRPRQWIGEPPGVCDFCRGPIVKEFVDGRTTFGPWAFMCPVCYPQYGVGLGTGFGQKYSNDGFNNWLKVEG